MPHNIILASKSAVRRELLKNAGVTFTCNAADIDEDALRVDGQPVGEAARTLAQHKAQDVSARHPGALVIGADQMLEFDGGILNKPRSISEARKHLEQLRGRNHRLISAAVIVCDSAVVWRCTTLADLHMRAFSDGFLDAYMARMGDDLLSTVGGYKLEQYGIRLFSRINGDYFTVLGLPLLEILTYLAGIGAIEK